MALWSKIKLGKLSNEKRPADHDSGPQKGGGISQRNPRRGSSPSLLPRQLVREIISGNQEKENGDASIGRRTQGCADKWGRAIPPRPALQRTRDENQRNFPG